MTKLIPGIGHHSGMKRKPFQQFRKGQVGRVESFKRTKKRVRPIMVVAARPELKFFDTTKAATAAPVAGLISDGTLLNMAEGNTDQTRIGNKITLKSVMMRGAVRLPTTAGVASTSDVVRIFLFHDKQANGAAPAVTDILTSANYRAFNNVDNSDRFLTFASFDAALDIKCGAGDGTTNEYGEATLSFFMKKQLNLPIKYKSNNGDVTDLASSNIGVLTISKDGIVVVDYIARVKYTDL